MVKYVERMLIHFDNENQMAERMRIDYDHTMRKDAHPVLTAFIHTDKVWTDDMFDQNMEVIVTLDQTPVRGALQTGRKAPPVGVLRGRYLRTMPSNSGHAWRWLAVQVRFKATEGPEVFITEQKVQITGDGTPQTGPGHVHMNDFESEQTSFGFIATQLGEDDEVGNTA